MGYQVWDELNKIVHYSTLDPFSMLMIKKIKILFKLVVLVSVEVLVVHLGLALAYFYWFAQLQILFQISTNVYCCWSNLGCDLWFLGLA